MDTKEAAVQETGRTARGSAMPGPTSNSLNPFLNIPPELLSQVAGYLDPIDLQTLRLVCRGFYHQLVPPHWLDWATTSNRFAFATILDREGMLGRTIPCSACATLHDRSCFSATELARDPGTRECEGSKRRLYFRPGYSLSAQQLRAKFEEVSFGMRQIDGFDEWSCTTDPVPIVRQDSEESKGYILQPITLMECAPMQIPLKRDVAAFLRRFNVPICPHRRTGDQAVMEAYFPGAIQEAEASVPDSSSVEGQEGALQCARLHDDLYILGVGTGTAR